MKKNTIISVTLIVIVLLCVAVFVVIFRNRSTNQSPSLKLSTTYSDIKVPPSQSAQTSSVNANASSPSNSLYSEINNQLSVNELRQKLDELKAIEQEARQLARMRKEENWEAEAAKCMKIMQRLKPRASAIRDESKRMLSPAGINLVGAAMNLIGCINCVEGDDDDCEYARDFIRKAETELRHEIREAKNKK
jgi:hypothetical protein